ncbi:MAG: toll/interleukin-1 receptor domain-containing protein [Acidimicrobiia bacterium]
MKIFLSYRRDDTAGYAGRLADGLAEKFGAPHVFRDVDSIPAGTNFVKKIESAVASCDVLVAVIGREWLNVTNAAGQRRLDDPEDFVRLEIAAALARDIPVLPVLVEGATMPAPKALPPALAPLCHQNALEISDTRWDYDMGRLVSAIDPHTDAAPPKARPGWLAPAAVAASVAVVLAMVVVLLAGGGDDQPVRGAGDVASVRIVRPVPFALGYPEVVEIEATGLPPGTVWYVLQPEGEEHYQPDLPPARLGDNRWSGEVWAGVEGESGTSYILTVVVADEAASRAFADYLERAQATGDYPGFDRLPDGASVVSGFVVTRR